MKDERLTPCPICGRDAELAELRVSSTKQITEYTAKIKCQCGISFDYSWTEVNCKDGSFIKDKNIFDAWNERAAAVSTNGEKVYIDRDALLEATKATDAYFQIKSILTDLPAADVVPGEELDKARVIIKLLENDVRDLTEQLEGELEDVYADFMRDYKLMRDELTEAQDEVEHLMRCLPRAEQYVAKEIFKDLWEMVIPEKCTDGCAYYLDMAELTELEKKYTEGRK